MRHLALLLPAFLAFATLTRAQSAVPVDCPEVVDVNGTRLGPVLSTGEHDRYGAISPPEALRQSVVMVALAANDEVFFIHVRRDHLVGTLLQRVPGAAWFTAADCTGEAWTTARTSADTFSVAIGTEDAGPVPPSVVVGPLQTVYLLDAAIPQEDVAVQSVWGWGSPGEDAGACFDYGAPRTIHARRMRRVADLAPDYQPPFRVVPGNCPPPGNRNGNGNGNGNGR